MLYLFISVLGLAICVVAVVLFKKSKEVDKRAEPTYPPPDGPPSTLHSSSVYLKTSKENTTKSQPPDDSLPPWALVQPSLCLHPEMDDQKSPVTDTYAAAGAMSDLDMAHIRAEMESTLKTVGRPLPTKSQWQMILSNSRATRVIAGAGSGKSTALSLRVVAMHKYLGIPLEHISVVTFTRASRSDMVKKLICDMRTFGVEISEGTGRRIVRTFHSMIISQVTATSDIKFIEHVGSDSDATGDTEELGTLNPRQLDYLRKVYADTYHENQSFRKSIGLVLLEKISALRQSKYNDAESLERAMAVAEPRDYIVSQAITDAWLAKDGLNTRNSAFSWEPTPINASRGTWYANGRLLSTGMPIVLGCGGITAASKLPLDPKYHLGDNDKDRTLGFISNVRLKVLATVATERYLYIETEDDLADLCTYIDWIQPEVSLENGKDTFPAFSIRIPGDTSSTSIFECLYSLGTFIASMGLPVPATSDELSVTMREEGCPIEANICSALREFWPALHRAGHGTYNELFLSYGNVEQAQALPTEAMLPMKHLLVDEFQDISGQIIKWIRAIHSVLHQRGEHPSLMVVGDDWQSVYGWRGSDPEFLIHFDKHFGESELVVMNENYRSGQHIINSAELLVAHLKESALQKHGVASGQAASSLGQVELSYGDDKAILKLIDKIRKNEPDSTIFILSRTNEGLTPFRRYSKDTKITLLTMHRAKGLEADHVIIKGDCSYSNSSPLKNAIYDHAGLSNSYDASQLDEALRLAYVAITRAKKRAYWFGEPIKPDGAFMKLSQHMKPA